MERCICFTPQVVLYFHQEQRPCEIQRLETALVDVTIIPSHRMQREHMPNLVCPPSARVRRHAICGADLLIKFALRLRKEVLTLRLTLLQKMHTPSRSPSKEHTRQVDEYTSPDLGSWNRFFFELENVGHDLLVQH